MTSCEAKPFPEKRKGGKIKNGQTTVASEEDSGEVRLRCGLRADECLPDCTMCGACDQISDI